MDGVLLVVTALLLSRLVAPMRSRVLARCPRERYST